MVLVCIQRPENQDSHWCNSSLKAGRVETQEELMFPVKSKERKELMSQSKGRKNSFSLGGGFG